MNDPYDLRTSIGYQLTIAARTNNAQFEELLSKLGLTRQMWCVLVAVGEQKILMPSAIADYIGIIRPAVSRTLKKMQHNGLLYRTANGTDKRYTAFALTSKGQGLLRRSLPLAHETRENISAMLSGSEQLQLSNILKKLIASTQAKATGV